MQLDLCRISRCILESMGMRYSSHTAVPVTVPDQYGVHPGYHGNN